MTEPFAQLNSWDNLLRAYRQASRGKRGQPNVAAFEHRLEDHLLELQRDLRGRTYEPGAYLSFYIEEPKRRLISAAPFRDRVVHHALCNVIEPAFERSFVADSYANRSSGIPSFWTRGFPRKALKIKKKCVILWPSHNDWRRENGQADGSDVHTGSGIREHSL